MDDFKNQVMEISCKHSDYRKYYVLNFKVARRLDFKYCHRTKEMIIMDRGVS